MNFDLLPEIVRSRKLECFDNSAIVAFPGVGGACTRKGTYELIGPRGVPLRGGVGDGADFGTVIHHGIGEYYRHYYDLEYRDRVLAALYAADELYPTLFSPDRTVEPDRKHSRLNMLTILAAYFDRFREADDNYEVLATELGLAMVIKWEEGDPPEHKDFEPWINVMRCDNLLKRKVTGGKLAKELKTLGYGGIKDRMELLAFNTQTVSYSYCIGEYLKRVLKEDPSFEFMGDVVLVSASQIDFARDTFPLTPQMLHNWRYQTIIKVEKFRQYRELMAARRSVSDPNYWNYATMDTERCNDYMHKCYFYDLCKYGPMSPASLDLPADDWNPFFDIDEKDIVVFG